MITNFKEVVGGSSSGKDNLFPSHITDDQLSAKGACGKTTMDG
ncbi:MAG: hypothetical protein ACJ0PA_03465 [Flavobacteriaceae bacterium]